MYQEVSQRSSFEHCGILKNIVYGIWHEWDKGWTGYGMNGTRDVLFLGDVSHIEGFCGERCDTGSREGGGWWEIIMWSFLCYGYRLCYYLVVVFVSLYQ